MPHLVTSHQGEDHVESYNDRHYNAGHIGNDSYAFKGRGNFACSMVDSNTLRIMSGDAQCCGAHWSIDSDYEEYTIETGTPGYKRTDLVVAHIETAPQETMDIRVLKGEETTGTPVTPSYIEGDLNAGDTVVEMPLCSVELNGINPGQPNMLLDFLVPYKEFCDSLSQEVQTLISKLSRLTFAVTDKAFQIGITNGDLYGQLWAQSEYAQITIQKNGKTIMSRTL